MGKTNCFCRKERIKQSEIIQKLLKNGRHFSTNGAKLFLIENQSDINRIAFTIKKGYGNAVQRNVSKRYSREAYRISKNSIKTGFDMLLLIFPGNDNFSTRCEQLSCLYKKAGLVL